MTDPKTTVRKWRKFLATHFDARPGEPYDEYRARMQKRYDSMGDRDVMFCALCQFILTDVPDERFIEYCDIMDKATKDYNWGIPVEDEEVVMEYLLRFLGSPRRSLDVGCGPCGAFTFLQREGLIREATGIDASHYLLGVAQDLCAKLGTKITLEHGWMRQLPYPAGSFDFVHSMDALHWTMSWERAVAEMARVLASNGQLFLTYGAESGRVAIKMLRVVEILAGAGVDVEMAKTFNESEMSTRRVIITGTKRPTRGGIILATACL